jgi:hypothetical protein
LNKVLIRLNLDVVSSLFIKKFELTGFAKKFFFDYNSGS